MPATNRSASDWRLGPPRLPGVFNFSGSEIVFLLLLALIILGPEKLPDAVRKFGKTYAEFKKVTTGFQTELKSALDEPMREMKETADALRKAAQFDGDLDPKSMFAGFGFGGDQADKPANNAMQAVTPPAAEIDAAVEAAISEAAVSEAAAPEAAAPVAEPAEPERPPGPMFTSAAPAPRVVADNEPPLASGSSLVTPSPTGAEDGAESA